eukprot:Nitzschia sp. Nitz4//scaffold152_size53828//36897//37529//NITZ4_006747-RA/size53828-processed-gene-0.73-mRNA-1//1//CDS//3329537217//216//frame0
MEERVTTLERKWCQCPDNVPVDESIRRARSHVESLGLYSANWKWVPEPYYTLTLEQRAQLLGANDTAMLCKSLLLENKKVASDETDLETNPRFLMVVLQYQAELDVKKLATSIRKLRPVEKRLDESQFNFQVADASDNDRITGYAFNSVSPFGLKQPIPIYLSADIVPLSYFWMGGGHVHLKLGMSVTDFVKLPHVQVMDCSVERTTGTG